MRLEIDSIDVLPKLKDAIYDMVKEVVSELFDLLTEKYRKKIELPRYMTYKQTCAYMNTSYNTLTKKYMPAGLKSIVVEEEVKFDQKDCDAFFENHKTKFKRNKEESK